MNTVDKEIKVISLKNFLRLKFPFCFSCGTPKYVNFEIEGYLYRICKKCMRKRKLRNFFLTRYGFDVTGLLKEKEKSNVLYIKKFIERRKQNG